MKLKDLANKAAKLPEIDFDWVAVESYHSDIFNRQVKDQEGLIEYLEGIKDRIYKITKTIYELAKAYNVLKEIILETDIESDTNPLSKDVYDPDKLYCKNCRKNLTMIMKELTNHFEKE